MSLRSTKLRRAIVDILSEHDRPLAVPEIQRLLTKQGVTPHKTSLYRSLDKMSFDGAVQEILLDVSGLHYEIQREHHHHTLCGMCRAVTCVASDALEKSMARLEKTVQRDGFASTDHHIVLRGVCASCQT